MCQLYDKTLLEEKELLFTANVKYLGGDVANTSEEEYLHSSVLRFGTFEPYVPLRNATKRERLLFRSIGDIAAFVTYMAVNSNEEEIIVLQNRYLLLEKWEKSM